MMRLTSFVFAIVGLTAGATAALAEAGPTCRAIAGRTFVFEVALREKTGVQTFERSVAAGRIQMAAGGEKGRARYVTNGPGADFDVRDQGVICEGDDGLPPRLTLGGGLERQVEVWFRQAPSGDLVLSPYWPHSPTGIGMAAPQGLGTAGLWANACAALSGRFFAALDGEDTSRTTFQGRGVSDFADYALKAGAGTSSSGKTISCTPTTDFGPGAARLTVDAGPLSETTTGAIYAASRDRVLFVAEKPGRTVTGWFLRRP